MLAEQTWREIESVDQIKLGRQDCHSVKREVRDWKLVQFGFGFGFDPNAQCFGAVTQPGFLVNGVFFGFARRNRSLGFRHSFETLRFVHFVARGRQGELLNEEERSGLGAWSVQGFWRGFVYRWYLMS
jgi:hypothetical protein